MQSRANLLPKKTGISLKIACSVAVAPKWMKRLMATWSVMSAGRRFRDPPPDNRELGKRALPTPAE
jgi:hypothetical protein